MCARCCPSASRTLRLRCTCLGVLFTMKSVKVSDDGGVAVDDKFVLSSWLTLRHCVVSCGVTSCWTLTSRGRPFTFSSGRSTPDIALVIERVRASVSPIKENVDARSFRFDPIPITRDRVYVCVVSPVPRTDRIQRKDRAPPRPLATARGRSQQVTNSVRRPLPAATSSGPPSRKRMSHGDNDE